MLNWMDVILIVIFSAGGILGLFKANTVRYIRITMVAGFSFGMSVGMYEYLGAVCGDTPLCHGTSLLVLFILAIVIVIVVRKYGIVSIQINKFKSHPEVNRITSGFLLAFSAFMFSAIFMALMVSIATRILEADELSGSADIFVNGVIGSGIAKDMDSLAGYPAIIIGSVILLTGLMMSNSRFVKRLYNTDYY